MAGLLELAERIERYDPKLSADNRADELELHRDIVTATGEGSMNPAFEATFVRSLDAAMSLVPDKLFPGVSQNVHHGDWHAWMGDLDSEGPLTRSEANAWSPALALCAASLRALAAKDKGNE